MKKTAALYGIIVFHALQWYISAHGTVSHAILNKICEGDDIHLTTTQDPTDIIQAAKFIIGGEKREDLMSYEEGKRPILLNQRIYYLGPTDIIIKNATQGDTGTYEMHASFTNGKTGMQHFSIVVSSGCPNRARFYDMEISLVHPDGKETRVSQATSPHLLINTMATLNISIPKANPPVACSVITDSVSLKTLGSTNRRFHSLSPLHFRNVGNFSLHIRFEHPHLPAPSLRIINMVVEENIRKTVVKRHEKVCLGRGVHLRMHADSYGTFPKIITSNIIKKEYSVMNYVSGERATINDKRIIYHGPTDITFKESTMNDSGTYEMHVTFEDNSLAVHIFHIEMIAGCPDLEKYYTPDVFYTSVTGKPVNLSHSKNIHLVINTTVTLNISLPTANPPVSLNLDWNDHAIKTIGSEERTTLFFLPILYQKTGNFTIVLTMEHPILVPHSKRIIDIIVFERNRNSLLVNASLTGAYFESTHRNWTITVVVVSVGLTVSFGLMSLMLYWRMYRAARKCAYMIAAQEKNSRITNAYKMTELTEGSEEYRLVESQFESACTGHFATIIMVEKIENPRLQVNYQDFLKSSKLLFTFSEMKMGVTEKYLWYPTLANEIENVAENGFFRNGDRDTKLKMVSEIPNPGTSCENVIFCSKVVHMNNITNFIRFFANEEPEYGTLCHPHQAIPAYVVSYRNGS